MIRFAAISLSPFSAKYHVVETWDTTWCFNSDPKQTRIEAGFRNYKTRWWTPGMIWSELETSLNQFCYFWWERLPNITCVFSGTLYGTIKQILVWLYDALECGHKSFKLCSQFLFININLPHQSKKSLKSQINSFLPLQCILEIRILFVRNQPKRQHFHWSDIVVFWCFSVSMDGKES